MVWRWSWRNLQDLLRIEWADCDSVLAELRHDSIENVDRPCHRRRLADWGGFDVIVDMLGRVCDTPQALPGLEAVLHGEARLFAWPS